MLTPAEKHIQCLIALKALKKLKKLHRKRRKRCYSADLDLENKTTNDTKTILLKDILWEGGNDFSKFCSLDIQQFEEIHALIEPHMNKTNTQTRYVIPSRERLAITLRYIGTGDSYRSLESVCKIPRKIITKFVPAVLNAIVDGLEVKYIKTPSSEGEWSEIAKGFDKFWDFPHTLGSLDGKHIRIKAAPHLGSDFYSDEGEFPSLALLAIADAYSRFIYIDVSGKGRSSDADVLKNCSLYQELMSGQLNIPTAEPLKGQKYNTPYYFISDNAFGLDRNFLKAYYGDSNLSPEEKVFNYRLSRARSTVEMAFRRMAARFQIFQRPIEIGLSRCDVLVKACCVLYNYFTRNIESPLNVEVEPELLPKTFTPLGIQEYDTDAYAYDVRDSVCQYCVADGCTPME